ncbi:DUF4116 domain-containing protein [Candidatus Pelagibacter sp.]|nr:DUF4116 domain-containing protein [Candidatus Pelagibacter sp.]
MKKINQKEILTKIKKGVNRVGHRSYLKGDTVYNGDIIYEYKEFFNNKKVMYTAAKRGLTLSKSLPEKFLKDKKFIKLTMLSYGAFNFKILKEIKSKFYNDEEISLISIKANDWNINYINKKFIANKKFIEKAVKIWAGAIAHASRKILKDREFVLKSIKLFANEKKRKIVIGGDDKMYDLIKIYSKDKELILELMKYDPRPAYLYADNKFKLDREFTLNAVKRSGGLLDLIPKKFKTDREISLIAAKSYGWEIIEYLHPKFRSDAEIILTSLLSTPHSAMPLGDEGSNFFWKYVDKKLQNNKDFILKAMKHLNAYQLWSDVVFTDKELIDAYNIAHKGFK